MSGAREIRQIAIIGCGTIGASWAAYFLAQGFVVQAYDPVRAARADFRARVAADMVTLGAEGTSIGACDSLVQAVQAADLIVENAPESVELKRALIRELQTHAPPQAIIASSTSSLKHSDIAQDANDPERVVVAHPFNPPHLMPLVELYGPQPEVVEQLAAFYRQIGKQPVVLRKEMVGHIANRLSSALWREALYLLQEGVASVEDIDRAVTAGPGLRWAIQGPFLTYHLGGGRGGIRHYLEHLGPSQEYRWASLGTPVVDQRLKEQVAADVEAAVQGRPLDELFVCRDQMLLAVQSAMQESDNAGERA